MPRESLVLFSDLDESLLDGTTYGFDAARPALDRLRRERIPLVLCTSKTRAEVEPLRTVLENRDPFIVENGGGIHIPSGYFPFAIFGAVRRETGWVVPIGDRYADLVEALTRASYTSGTRVRGFADMSDEESLEDWL